MSGGRGALQRAALAGGAVLVLALLLVYFYDDGASEVDVRLKMMSWFAGFLFWGTGMYEGSSGFNRPLWDATQLKISPGHYGAYGYDGVETRDFSVPSTWGRDSVPCPEGAERDGAEMHNGLCVYQVPLRIFLPPQYQNSQEKLPVLFYLHGGGFVIGARDELFYDILCRWLAVETGMAVVGVSYRLAPENKFPAALLDCYSAIFWLKAGTSHPELRSMLDASKVAVGGDSAGGTLSIGVTLLIRDKKEFSQIQHQTLIYPGTYYSEVTDSMVEYGNFTFLLPQGARTALWFHKQYTDQWTNSYDLSDEDDADTDIDPVFREISEAQTNEEGYPIVTQPYLNTWEQDTLADLPTTHVVLAERDPFRDEGKQLAERLRKDGVQTKVTLMENTSHGFIVLPFLPETRAAIAEISTTLQDRFRWSPIQHG